MKIILISLFSCVWLMAVGQREEKMDKEKEENIFITPVTHTPIFGTCIDEEQRVCTHTKLIEFFVKNIKWPQRVSCYEGTILISWIVELDGNISNVKFLRDTPEVWENEILRIIEKMPKWIPAKRNGKPIRKNYFFPLRIKLEG